MTSELKEIPIPTYVCEEAAALTREQRDALSQEFLALSSLETATRQRRLAMLRVLDAANVWEGWPSCAEWLHFNTSISLVTARTYVRIARQLAYLPIVDEAFGRGELSYSKARLLCSVLQPEVTDPRYERRLVDLARAFTTEQLRRVIGCTRNALKGGAEAAAERERRTCFRVEQLAGGMTAIQCFLPSDVAARVVSVVECAMEDLVKKRPQAPAGDPVETLEELAGRSEESEEGNADRAEDSESAPAAETEEPDEPEEAGVVRGSAADPTGSNGPRRVGDPAGSPRAEGLRPSVGMADGFVAVFEHYLEHRSCGRPGKPGEVLLTVSVDTLTGTMANRCQLGPALVQQWTCDAVVQPVLTDAKGEALDVGRRHRVVPPRLRRALGLRDGEVCQFPGCGARAFLEAHHLEHWLEGGETKIDNLALICRRHHRFLHQAKFSLELTSEGLVFRNPSGKALALPELPVASNPSRELGLLLRESKLTPGGLKCLDGKTNYDLSMAVGGIVHYVKRGQMKGPLAPVAQREAVL